MYDVQKFNGDDYVELALNENQITDLDNMLSFINNHKNIYLFGNGKCGQGLYEYLIKCDIKNIVGFITSNSLENFLNSYDKGRDGIVLALKADYFREILPNMWGKVVAEDVFFLRERSKEIFAQIFSEEFVKNHFWLTLPLARHCNINCAACSMYAPLCDREFYTLENVKKDLLKIKETGIYLAHINISGGEPFLNPEIVEILESIRELFPTNKIDVYTNGLPLLTYKDEQFESLKRCNIEVQITEYEPSREKLSYVYEMLNKHQIFHRIDFFEEQKLFFKKPLNFGQGMPITEYINCQYYTFAFSVFAFNGVIYKCATALCADAINKYADGKLEVTEKDYLELKDVTSAKQIYDFWKSRLPMCRYCPRVTEAITWKRSEKKIEEWM